SKYKQLGTLKIVFNREIPIQIPFLPLENIASWSLKREGTEWYAIASLKMTVEEPIKKPKTVGIDRGVVLAIADSDGRTVSNPKFYADSKQQLTRAQREASRKKRGFNNQTKAYAKVAKLQRKIARQRENF